MWVTLSLVNPTATPHPCLDTGEAGTVFTGWGNQRTQIPGPSSCPTYENPCDLPPLVPAASGRLHSCSLCPAYSVSFQPHMRETFPELTNQGAS